MKKVIGLAAAVIAVLGVAGCAGLGTAKASATPHAQTLVPVKVQTSTKTYSMEVAGLKRSYEVIAPVKGLPKSAPIVVFLSGIGASIASEVNRDDLVPYAATDQAELVYPAGYDDSWNAISCCGEAATKNVNDLAFMDDLVAQIDPGHARPVYLVGFSNGGRLAYRVICTNPGLFDEYTVIKAGPPPDCGVTKPVTILEIASSNDPEVPYKPGDHGLANEPLPMTTLVARLHSADQCPSASTEIHQEQMTMTTWSGCADGTRLGFAVWSTGKHLFPRPPVTDPAASPAIWSFLTKTPLAPLP